MSAYDKAADGNGGSFKASGRKLVFDDLNVVPVNLDFAVYDSNRFLVVEAAGDDSAPPGATVVVNRLDELERKVPRQ